METKDPRQEEWQRFGKMRPRLRPHVQFHRQYFRSELWYVVQNKASGRFHRLTPAAYQLVGRFDGKKTLLDLMEQGERSNSDENAINREEAVLLVKQLSHSDLLLLEQQLPIEFYRNRLSAQSRMRGWRRFLNPLALRFPLFDPNRFLARTQIVGQLLFSLPGLLLWFLVLVYAAGLAGVHWDALTGNFIDRILGAENIFILLFVFPVVKALHELGHGYATRRWGGEVHEIGIMFLVFMPIPYIDASAATAFRERRHRMVVAAAGMMVEVFLASLAMILWASAEPGMVRAVAFNVIFLAGVSTLLFNGNPLLRYDGYYMLGDMLEMPNLGPRANQYIGYLIQRYLFRAEMEFPETTASERGWLFGYGILSFCYRMFVWMAIIFFVATKFFFFGVLMAVWGATLMLLKPLYKISNYLFTSPRLAPVRTRAVSVSALFLCFLAVILFLLPLPYTKLAEGVVWLPEGSLVRARAAGFIVAVEQELNSEVVAGTVLIRMEDPLAVSEVEVLKTQQEELEAEFAALEVEDRVRAGVVAEHISLLRSRLQKAQETLDDMLVTSTSAGRFVPVEMGDLLGRYAQKGQVIGYVLGDLKPTIKTIVNQQDYLLVRDRFIAIEALFAEDRRNPIVLDVIREVPAASDQLPSRVLSQAGGGDYYLDPSDSGGNKALQSHFEFELAVRETLPTLRSGGRVFVRFDLGSEPIFWRLYRSLRQLFLREFSV